MVSHLNRNILFEYFSEVFNTECHNYDQIDQGYIGFQKYDSVGWSMLYIKQIDHNHITNITKIINVTMITNVTMIIYLKLPTLPWLPMLPTLPWLPTLS